MGFLKVLEHAHAASSYHGLKCCCSSSFSFSPATVIRYHYSTKNWHTNYLWVTESAERLHTCSPVYLLPCQLTPTSTQLIYWKQHRPLFCADKLLTHIYYGRVDRKKQTCRCRLNSLCSHPVWRASATAQFDSWQEEPVSDRHGLQKRTAHSKGHKLGQHIFSAL